MNLAEPSETIVLMWYVCNWLVVGVNFNTSSVWFSVYS